MNLTDMTLSQLKDEINQMDIISFMKLHMDELILLASRENTDGELWVKPIDSDTIYYIGVTKYMMETH